MKISALLNTSLCQLKIKNWKDLLLTIEKILKLDEFNVKAIYRKAFALYNLEKFEEAYCLINKYLANAEI